MRNYSKIILLILTFMAVVTFSQRGGSRSKSSSSSSRSGGSYRRSHRGLGSYFGYGDTQNCMTNNGVTTCTYTNNQISWGVTAAIVGAGLAIGAFGYKKAADNAKKRQEIIDTVMNEFSSKYLDQSTSISSEQKSKLVQQFMNKKYTMIVNVKDKDQKFFCQVKVIQIKPIGQNNPVKYTIKMSGNDEVGTSKFQGLIMFKTGGLRLKLSKVYDDRTKAQQTGEFDILLYQGQGTPENIAGDWAFKGHQNSFMYSGDWTMKQI